MPPILALLIGLALAWYAFRADRKYGNTPSKALFWPTLWYLVVASRPVGVWLYLWGVPVPGGSGDPTEGSSIERFFFAGLTVIGLVILARRRFRWGQFFAANPWMTALFVLMAASILWSQYPFVSLKRYIKALGSLTMVLIVLTEERPLVAVLTVLRRGFFIHLPMSIVCVKYYRDIGVSFDWSGEAQFWQGISTSKNTLGQVAMLATLCFSWEVARHWRERKWKNIYFAYLLMAIYLLKGSEDAFSLTALVVSLFALSIFLGIKALRRSVPAVRRYVRIAFAATAALVVLVLVHSVVLFAPDSLFGSVITTFGRDITLTDRTFIWTDVYGATADSRMLGVGYGGFWIGRMANIPWNEDMTWVLGQAHSGYVDTYLQLGALGCLLVAGLLLSTPGKLLRALEEDFDFAALRITLFLTGVFVNITESTIIRGDHQLWFVMQLAMWVVPAGAVASRQALAPNEAAQDPADDRAPHAYV